LVGTKSDSLIENNKTSNLVLEPGIGLGTYLLGTNRVPILVRDQEENPSRIISGQAVSDEDVYLIKLPRPFAKGQVTDGGIISEVMSDTSSVSSMSDAASDID
jgi:hypothetical protein